MIAIFACCCSQALVERADGNADRPTAKYTRRMLRAYRPWMEDVIDMKEHQLSCIQAISLSLHEISSTCLLSVFY